MYEIDLSGPRIVAGPASLPAELIGLAPESLADLSAALDPCPVRFQRRGFWPAVSEQPVYDPEAQRLSGQSDETPDAVARIVRVSPLVVNLTPAEIAARNAARLETARADKVAAVNAERERRLSVGAPFSGKRIDVSDKGRADLGGMSVAALLAQAGTVPWSDGYAQGWITQDNSRVPLPDPFDGIALAASVGDWYGRTMQHARDLKDAALAGDPAAVDELAGWP